MEITVRDPESSNVELVELYFTRQFLEIYKTKKKFLL